MITIHELFNKAVAKAEEVMAMDGRQAAMSGEVRKLDAIADTILKLAQAQAVLNGSPLSSFDLRQRLTPPNDEAVTREESA